MTNEESSELTQPGVGAFDDPSSFITAQLAAVFEALLDEVGAVGDDEVDAAFFEPLAQRIGVIDAVGDHALGLLSRPARGPRDADFGKRGFRKGNFGQGWHFPAELPAEDPDRRAVPSTSFPCRAWFCRPQSPFFSAAKLPSRNVSSHCSKPLASCDPSRARHASSQTPRSSHCFKRRQHLAGEGYLSGKNRHAAPVCSTTECPPGRPGCPPTGGLDYPSDASAPATAARSSPTTPRSTTRIASCSTESKIQVGMVKPSQQSL
jgi:hypothetical protein